MRSAKGFTLIELLIVIAIIAILAGVLIPNFFNARKRANAAAAQAYARQVATWLASADVAGTIPSPFGQSQNCNADFLKDEGAPDKYPTGVKECSISYDADSGKYTITVKSVNDDEFTVTY